MIRLARSQPMFLASSDVIGHSKSRISVIGYDKSIIFMRQMYLADVDSIPMIGHDKSEMCMIRHSMPRQPSIIPCVL